MGISIELITEELRKNYDITEYLSCKQDKYLKEVRLFNGELNPECIFVTEYQQIKDFPIDELENNYFVSIITRLTDAYDTKKFEGTNVNIIFIVANKNTVYAIFNKLINLFKILPEVLNKSSYCLENTGNIQAMLDKASPLLGDNICIIYDKACNVIASYDKNKKYDKITDILKRGYLKNSQVKTIKDTAKHCDVNYYYLENALLPYMKTHIYTYSQTIKSLNGYVAITICNEENELLCKTVAKHLARIVEEYLQIHGIKENQISTQNDLFVSDIINHNYKSKEYVEERAKSLGIDFYGTYRLGVVEFDVFSNLSLINLKRWMQASTYKVPFQPHIHEGRILIIMKGETSNLRTLQEMQESLSSVMKKSKKDKFRIGFSASTNSFLGFDIAYKQALAALSLGREYQPQGSIYFYTSMFSYDMLNHYKNKPSIPYLPKLLKLQQSDSDGSKDYQLLRTYLENDRSISKTASLLFMHRNSIIYRLNKISEVLLLDLDNPTTRLNLLLAFRYLDLIDGEINTDDFSQKKYILESDYQAE